MINRAFLNDFDKIYKILKDSFPKDEIRSYDGQKALFENDFYRVYCIREGDEIVSIAALWCFDEFTFIEHLATTPKSRDKGLGATILREIIDNSNHTVCLEVEPPKDEITRRRIAFYERGRMFLNLYPYIQPSLGEGREAIPLFIMTSNSKIDEETYSKIKHTLYKEVYNKQSN